jgi:hypothetical protein
MPSPARTAVIRRAPRRPVSRMFMACPFVVMRPSLGTVAWWILWTTREPSTRAEVRRLEP